MELVYLAREKFTTRLRQQKRQLGNGLKPIVK
ncbi:hypothetical protein [Chroococcidiopsis sp. SAG 2025]